MSDLESRTLNKPSLRDCLAAWALPSCHEERITENRSAYLVLLNAGMLLRNSKSKELPAEIASMSLEEQSHLVSAACEYAGDFSLPQSVRHALRKDELEPEELEACEDALGDIDELDVVLALSKRLVDSVLDRDDQLLLRLATAITAARVAAKQMLSRPDIVAIASRVLIPIRPLDWLPPGSFPDWFAKARECDAELSSFDIRDILAPLPSHQRETV